MKKITLIFTLFIVFTLSYSCKEESNNLEASIAKNSIVVPSSLNWSERMAQSVMHRFSEAWQAENADKPEWDYKIGLLLTSFEQLYRKTKEEKYKTYILSYTNKMIQDDGSILNYDFNSFNIDLINPGKILFFAYEQTNDNKYLKALETLRKQLEEHPRTNSGGFWHKKIYPYQMWLDGLYMGAPFYARYNVDFENGDKLDDVVHQFNEIQAHLVDEKTGLLYHGWDESKQMDWADDATGRSPGFWGRSLGWYMMAMVDALDYFPENDKGREKILGYLVQLTNALIPFQGDNGLWNQVPNKPATNGNYGEASSTAMFTYSIAKAVRNGYLPQKYLGHAKLAYDGLLNELVKVDANGEVHITKVCGSAGLGGNPYRDGTYNYYTNELVITDNLHGLGPFILASIEMEDLKS